MNTKMIFALLFCFLTTSGTPSFAVSDPVREQQFKDAIKDAVKVIRYKKSQRDTRLSAELYDFADSRFLDILLEENRLLFVRIDWTHEALTLETPEGTRVVDAINTPHEGLIQIRIGAWDEIYSNLLRRIAFAMHELLSVRSQDERDYQMTAPLLEILEAEYRPEVMLATLSQKTLNWLNADLRRLRNKHVFVNAALLQIKESEQGRACMSGRRREENCLYSMTYAQAALAIYEEPDAPDEYGLTGLQRAQQSLSLIQWGILEGHYSVRRWRREALVEQIDGVRAQFAEMNEQAEAEASAADAAVRDMAEYRNSLPNNLGEQAAALWIEERDRVDAAFLSTRPQAGIRLVMDRCRGRDVLAISCIFENLETMRVAFTTVEQFVSRVYRDLYQGYSARLEQLFRSAR